MNEDARVSGNRWVVIGLLTLVVSTSLSVNLLLGLLLPDISSDLGLSPSQQGWLGSSSLLTVFFLGIPMSSWCSRYRPWRVASLASLGVAGFVFLQARAPSFAVLLVGRVGTGFAYAMSQAPRALLVQQWSSRSQLAATNGAMSGGIDLCLGIAFLMTPFLLVWTGSWRSTLLVWGGLCLFAAVAWIALGEERETRDYRESLSSQSGTPLSTILKYKQLPILGLGIAGFVVTESAFSMFWPTLAQEQLGLSGIVVGLAIGLAFFTAAPSEVLVNVFPRLARRRFYILVACAFGSFGAHLGLVFTEAAPFVLTLFVVKGASIAFFPVVATMVHNLPEIRPREVAVGISFVYTCASLGAAVGPLLVGFLHETTGDLQQALLVTAFFPLSLFVSAMFVRS